ncbi:discoidin domain-containing protein [Oceanicoccus sagamiensis]|nr:discoidin domain-containing protein [Oceanicoccus sagamiensis]
MPHKALAKPLTVSSAIEKPELLLNGVIATDRIFQFHEWTEITEQGLLATIDLEDQLKLSQVQLGYQAGQYRRLYLPSAITVAVSKDGDDWQTVAEAGQATIKESAPRITLDFKAVTARYIRFTLENTHRAYSEEDRAIIAMPVYIDELVVY